MTDQISKRPHLGPSHEAEQNEYHALSGLAVVSLIIGILSIVSLVDPRASLVSAVGILVSCVALWRIARRSPELVGRKLAVFGLLLSLLFGSMAIGHCIAIRWVLARQSEQVCLEWFDLMQARRPELAYQLAIRPDLRAPADSDVWDYYCSNLDRHVVLGKFVDQPLSRTLLALGKKATVRFLGTEKITRLDDGDHIIQLYGVTFDQDGRKTTFLVRLAMLRRYDKIMEKVVWQIVGMEGGVRPAEEEEQTS